MAVSPRYRPCPVVTTLEIAMMRTALAPPAS
jgi:hypothetical protein